MQLLVPLLLACQVEAFQPAAELSRPEALQALETAHRAIRNGVIRWSYLRAGEPATALNFVNRYAENGDVIFENRGDDDGWTQFDRGTRQGIRRFPQLYLINADGYWWTQETGLGGRWYTDEAHAARMILEDVRDIRMNGMCPTSWSIQFGVGVKALWGREDDPIVRYETHRDEAHHVVKATTESGATTTWFICPQKGWNAERVVYEAGPYLSEAMSVLEEVGGVWLPTRTDYFEKGSLVESVVVKEAEINRPDGPRRFTLADIDMQPGEPISPQDKPPPPIGKPLVWNGEAVSEWDDWMADLKSGKRDWGARMKLVNAGIPYDSPYMTDAERARLRLARAERLRRSALHRHEGLWAQYVRDFIAKYRLNDEQTQKALLVLSECQQKARNILEKRRSDFQAALNSLEEAGNQPGSESHKRATARLEELRKPIDAIFAGELVPRLDKLPTRSQRSAAATTSAPAQP